MKANFSKSLKAVLVHEGGFSNHPADKGGPTMRGITQKVYDAWRVGRGQEKRSVRQIDNAEISKIYEVQYWAACQCDVLPSGIDYVVFDGAVNSGPSQSIKFLQKALTGYTGPVDGILGVRTLRRVKEDDNNDALVARICERRMAFLRALRTWSVFGAGWTKRVEGVKAIGQAMASGKVMPKLPVAMSSAGAEKAPETDVQPPPTKGVADAVTGAGTAVTTGSLGIQSTISDAMDQLQPLAGYSASVSNILTYLAIAGAVLIAGGLAWRAIAKWRGAKLAEAAG